MCKDLANDLSGSVFLWEAPANVIILTADVVTNVL